MSSLRNSYYNLTKTEQSILLRDMTLDGSPAGNPNANVDGSVTPVKFYITPSANQDIEVVQVGIEVSDSGNPGLDDYGNIAGPLLNGIQFFVEVDGVEVNVFNPLTSNRELINLGPVVERAAFSGSTVVNLYSFNAWQHAKSGLMIRGDRNEKFGVKINDNLSSLIAHTFVVKGNIRLASVA